MIAIRPLILLLVFGVLLPVSSASAQNSLLDRWYTALFDVNRVAIADLLADDAVITLEDLGVTQTRAEFIEALDEWEEAVENANLAWQLEAGEVFGFRASKIVSSVQTTVGDSCENF